VRPLGAAVVVSVVAALFLAGCSSGNGASPAGAGKRPARTVTVDEHANGTRVELRVGDSLRVVLHSTYWQLPTPRAGVLVVTGAPQATATPGCSRIPGTGCGTATATYAAHRTGSTKLAAHQDSCGEALRCTGSEGDWSIVVHAKA
jgi:hypothetical protein